jgi:hypothetical protein
VFRFAASAETCRTLAGLISDYADDDTQYITFIRSSAGLKEVAYFVRDDTLYRAEWAVEPGDDWHYTPGAPPSQATAMAKGVIYFGCEFQNRYTQGGPDEETRALDALQRYWREADSVPPYVRVIVAMTPLSGPKQRAELTRPISATDTTVYFDSTRPFVIGRSYQQFVRIGGEWIRYEGLKKDRFTGCTRGMRGTLPAAHESGTGAIGGETFHLDIAVPGWGYRNR